MGMAEDLANQGTGTSTGDPELDQWAQYRTSPTLNQLLARGIPPNVAAYMLGAPSFAEGERPHSSRRWDPVNPYRGEVAGPDEMGSYYEQWLLDHLRQDQPRGRNVSYQPGGTPMPGDLQQQPFVSPSLPGNSTQATLAGMGSPSLHSMDGLTPDMLKRIQLYHAIMGMGRGAGGMQLNPNTNNLINQLQGGGQQGGGMGLSPQIMALLNYWQQMQGQGGPGSFPQSGGGVSLAQLLGAPQPTGQPT